MRDFAASPIDPATPQENQRLETRDVGASKRAFRARLPPIFTIANLWAPPEEVLNPIIPCEWSHIQPLGVIPLGGGYNDISH
jgi:hypothetical protein